MDPYNFDSPDADVIIRSGGVKPTEYRVHRCILAISSPVFRCVLIRENILLSLIAYSTMFSLPQSDSGTKKSTPVVDVSEGRATLDALLRLLYPIPDPKSLTLDEIGPVIDAAMKYEIIVVLNRLRKLLISPEFLEKQPLRVYAIATHWEFEEEMKIASGYTLGVDIINSPTADTLNNIATSHYRRLLIFHLERAAKAQQCLGEVSPKQATCSSCRGFVDRWHEIYKRKAKDELSLRPTSAVICSFDFLAPIADSIDAGDCGMTSCRRSGRKLDVYRSFLEHLKKRIDELPSTI
jgi:BTB/POZ domain